MWIRSCGKWNTGEAVKNKANSVRGQGSATWHATPARGASTPNKPNFGKSNFEDKCCADKDLQCIEHGENPRKTKPISRSLAQRRCRPWRPSGAPIFQYSSIPAFQFHADRSKQSQFAPGRCRARTPTPRRAEGDRAKQSQFRSTAGETLRLRTTRRDLQCSGDGLGIVLARTSHGEREL